MNGKLPIGVVFLEVAICSWGLIGGWALPVRNYSDDLFGGGSADSDGLIGGWALPGWNYGDDVFCGCSAGSDGLIGGRAFPVERATVWAVPCTTIPRE